MKNLKLILKSLINNESVVAGARSKPWYFAIIMFFVGMIISIVPTFVGTLTRNGADFVNTTNVYGYDLGVQRFAEVLDEKEFDLIVGTADSGNYLSLFDRKYEATLPEGTKDTRTFQQKWDAVFTDVNTNNMNCWQHKNSSDVIDFEVYYTETEITSHYLDLVINTFTKNEQDEEVKTKKYVNFIIFSEKTFMSFIYSNGSTASQTGSLYADYMSYEVGYNFRNICKVKDGDEVLTKATATTPTKLRTYTEGVFANWKESFNVGYTNNKYTSLWQTTLLIFGINVGITIFMGLMVFLLTRGKTNPFRIYTFWDCQKIAYWAIPAPSVISLALGFFMSNFALVSFALVVGLRVMWLSMRTLRPENANDVTTAEYNSKEVKTVKAKPVK